MRSAVPQPRVVTLALAGLIGIVSLAPACSSDGDGTQPDKAIFCVKLTEFNSGI